MWLNHEVYNETNPGRLSEWSDVKFVLVSLIHFPASYATTAPAMPRTMMRGHFEYQHSRL